MPDHPPAALLRLRPGIRVSRRGGGHLQVGLHDDQRVVVPDHEPVRRLLTALGHGVQPERIDPGCAALLATLLDRGVVVPVDDEVVRDRLRDSAYVDVSGRDPARATALRMLATAGLRPAPRDTDPAVTLVVTTGAEPRRELLDRAMRSDLPHLPLTIVAGRVRLGPLVVPGLTACVRCVDEHLTDRDPRYPLVLEQHHDRDDRDTAEPGDLQLALAWAVRDLVLLVDGGRPATWSATVVLSDGTPRVDRWQRHPRCGCAWGDALVGRAG